MGCGASTEGRAPEANVSPAPAAVNPKPQLPAGASRPTSRRSSVLHASGDAWITRQTSAIRKTFEFVRELNKGHFGVVYEIRNAAGEAFACKQISKLQLESFAAMREVRREIEILYHLRGHPNVTTFYAVFEDADDLYLVMELCRGGDLYDTISTMKKVPEAQASDMFRRLVEVVMYCHSLGVVHRDIKPENFLIAGKEKDALIKLSDFGLSSFYREGQEMNDVVGSAYYIAPEVLSKEYGKSCDAWSLGVLLHVMLVGKPPFGGANSDEVLRNVRSKELDLGTAVRDGVSAHACHLMSRLLDKDPKRRIQLDQVLAHPWLRPEGSPPLLLPFGGLRERLVRYGELNALEREARRVLGTALPSEASAGIQMVFEQLDTNCDGLISMAELRAGLSRRGDTSIPLDEMNALLSGADVNGDGFLDSREFIAAIYSPSRMEPTYVLKRTFQHFDTDADGFISPEELEVVLSRQAGLASRPSAAELIAAADVDKDGRLDFSEFAQMLLKARPHEPMFKRSVTIHGTAGSKETSLPGQVDDYSVGNSRVVSRGVSLTARGLSVTARAHNNSVRAGTAAYCASPGSVRGGNSMASRAGSLTARGPSVTAAARLDRVTACGPSVTAHEQSQSLASHKSGGLSALPSPVAKEALLHAWQEAQVKGGQAPSDAAWANVVEVRAGDSSDDVAAG